MSDQDELAPREREAWLALSGMLSAVPAALERHLQRDAGLSLVEFQTLSMLANTAGHRVRMSDLAAAASSSPSRISRVVTGLVSDGLVIRSADPADRRVVYAALTPEGSARFRAASPGHARLMKAALFDRLSSSELEKLVKTVSGITDAFDESGRGAPSS
ncbi:MarR family transcriptional regulator [Streptomyces sp. CA-210063]|uniref:MarR family winged helix-turn-helix transcriptional regulator n=1 Tax=Streptomyces sp. CA-210063 TaxID=2801029 RepID=UPI00214CF617|nr:MarR family transcriptional regulator [Streptomyces sp. CA-210063]UUU36641.1 MarR family transcriptional regulator [Streptomyces sp. CA-210063]